MQVRCGNHNGQTVYHASANEVRACYTGQTVGHAETSLSQPARSATLDRLATQHQRNDAAREVDPREGRATGPQVKFLRGLLASKDIPAHEFEWSIRIEAALGNEDIQTDGREAVTECTLGKREASAAITKLKGFRERTRYTETRQAKATAAATTVIKHDGIYIDRSTGEIFKVQFNKASGDGSRLYAKQLVKVARVSGETFKNGLLADSMRRGQNAYYNTWVYQKGLMARIRPEWRMTMAEAEKYGALYGKCMNCHRDLTDEKSIARAMGPVCAARGNWA